MEYLEIAAFDDYRVEAIYFSYCTTFPEDERRNQKQFNALFNHPKAKIFSVLNDLNTIGYLVVWELSHFAFVEHFEIFEEHRSKKYGSEIIGDLAKKYAHLILEVEPEHFSDDAKRRIGFYEKNGLEVIDKDYIQPSYDVGKNSLSLWLMANWQPEQKEQIKEEIYDIVYR